MPAPLRKPDILDADIVDSDELGSDGTLVYLTTTVVSTTSGTKVVVINLPADGEGIRTGFDHLVEALDKATLTGTSGGLGNGTFTVATVISDTSFSVVEAIGTSTGGSVSFKYDAGAKRVGVSPTTLAATTATNVQTVIQDIDHGLLLDTEPVAATNTYAATRTGGVVTQESWTNTATSALIKTIVYTRTGGVVTQELRTVYASDGTTVVAQETVGYSRTGGVVTGATYTRNV